MKPTDDYRVLVIDDDRLVRSSLVDLVEAAGWQAKDLPRATEADRWISQFKPDVILSDVRMPQMLHYTDFLLDFTLKLCLWQ